MSVWSLAFWKATAERAVRTALQTATAMLGVGVLDVRTIDWIAVASVVSGATLLSVAMSVLTGLAQGSGPGLTEVPSDVVKQDAP